MRVWFTRRERRRRHRARARWFLEMALSIRNRVRRAGDAHAETIVEKSVRRFREQLEALREP